MMRMRAMSVAPPALSGAEAQPLLEFLGRRVTRAELRAERDRLMSVIAEAPPGPLLLYLPNAPAGIAAGSSSAIATCFWCSFWCSFSCGFWCSFPCGGPGLLRWVLCCGPADQVHCGILRAGARGGGAHWLIGAALSDRPRACRYTPDHGYTFAGL